MNRRSIASAERYQHDDDNNKSLREEELLEKVRRLMSSRAKEKKFVSSSTWSGESAKWGSDMQLQSGRSWVSYKEVVPVIIKLHVCD